MALNVIFLLSHLTWLDIQTGHSLQPKDVKYLKTVNNSYIVNYKKSITSFSENLQNRPLINFLYLKYIFIRRIQNLTASVRPLRFQQGISSGEIFCKKIGKVDFQGLF